MSAAAMPTLVPTTMTRPSMSKGLARKPMICQPMSHAYLCGADAGDDHGKLVAADTGHEPVADEVLEAGGDLPEQAVAGLVAVGVVDLLEAVEIEIDHRDRCAGGAPGRDRGLQCRDQRGAVGQAGQPVVGRVVARRALAPLDVAKVAEGHDEDEAHGQADQTEHQEKDRADAWHERHCRSGAAAR